MTENTRRAVFFSGDVLVLAFSGSAGMEAEAKSKVVERMERELAGSVSKRYGLGGHILSEEQCLVHDPPCYVCERCQKWVRDGDLDSDCSGGAK